MSLTNIISEKIANSVMANNQALSKLTVTTLATAGTSIPDIVKETTDTANESMVRVAGEFGNGFYKPVLDMRDHATALDSANASRYGTNAEAVISQMNSSVATNLKGVDNSLFDIQKFTKESISSGVDSYANSMERFSPAISKSAVSVGISRLPEAGRLVDLSTTTAFNSSGSFLTSKINSINNKVIDVAVAEQTKTASKPVTKDLPAVTTVEPSVSSNPNANTVIISGITEGVATSSEQNSTDVIMQNVALYVEGVQLPFESISIGQSIGQLPTASFQVPPDSGLMDIIRGYQPKVHIFYTDNITGGDRLLFWGHIIACNYSYSQQQGGASISFECVHKNALLQQITFEWSGGGAAHAINGGSQTDTNPDQASAQINNFNSEFSIARALQGIVGPQENSDDLISPTNPKVSGADPTRLDKRFKALESRMIGMPTSIMNLWNQIKLEVYSNEKLNIIFSKMFVPLLEDGVRFFDRLTGHNFLESQIQNGRVPYCNDKARPELSKNDMLLPPAFRVGIQSAVQTNMTINSLKSSLGFSGELTNFYDLFTSFYYSIEYELLTLASPAEVAADPELFVDSDDADSWRKVSKMAVETIVKPQIPFYYAPICNVLLPNMFHSVSVSQNEVDVPTRITAIGTAASQASDNPNLMGVNYRAPQSIREAIALGRKTLDSAGATDASVTLRDTTGSSFNLPGMYEVGRGINHRKIAMPNWLSHFSKDQDSNRASNSDQEFPVDDSIEAKNILDLHNAWIQKYGYKNVVDPETGEINEVRDESRDGLDPYSVKSNIMAYERLLFSTSDYEYSKAVAGSRNGSVEGVFNPYIVPGYPMDIIDGSPNHPCFHAMCSSVTHSITSRSIGTSIGFLAGSTYNELSNYYMQPIHPWLKTALSMVNVERSAVLTEGGTTEKDASTAAAVSGPTSTNKAVRLGLTPVAGYDSNSGDVVSIQQGILNNPRAKEVADKFYRSVLGVGAADPGLIYNFETGRASPIARRNGNWVPGSGYHDSSPKNGGEGNPNLTGVGNTRLVSRQVEGKKGIEAKFGIKFIDLTPQNYNSTSIVYQNQVAVTNAMLEPGASMFLNYGEVNSLLEGIAK